MNPFEQLRDAGPPRAPDVAFVDHLRSRVSAALAADRAEQPPVPPTNPIELPERRSLMSTDRHETTPATEVTQIVPYLCVGDAAAAIDWYRDVLGAVEVVRFDGDDGRIGHAEVTIGGARLMLSDPYPEAGVGAPTQQYASSTLVVNVPDVDDAFRRASSAGATVVSEPADQPYGDRSCTMIDPFGHRWMIQSRIAELSYDEINAAMEGFTATPAASDERVPIELGYLTIGADDTVRATQFFGALFGWETEPGNMGDQYAHVENTKLPLGFSPDGSSSAPVLYFRVTDVAAFAERVRELGGTVRSEDVYESGVSADCVDDQGRSFHLWQPAPGY